MPTPSGLPKTGEVWERTLKLPPDWLPHVTRFVVIERGRGDYWPLRVWTPTRGVVLLVDMSYALQRGELRFLGPASDRARSRAGLPPVG